MTMSLPVRVVLASGQTFNRGRFGLAVMGILMVQGQDCRIIDDCASVAEIQSMFAGRSEADDESPAEPIEASIRIVDPTFLSRLSADISPLPSGDFAYFDTAMICGITRLDGDEVVLDEIWSAIVYRDGREFGQ